MTSSRGAHAAVLGVALLARLLFFGASHPWKAATEQDVILTGDARGYEQLACNLLVAHRFSYDAAGPPESLRTPAYPLFLSAIYAVFGPHPWIALLAQILLDVVTCSLVISLAEVTLGSGFARWAGWIYALDPFLWLHTNSLLSETLFLFLTTLGGLFLARGLLVRVPGRDSANTDRIASGAGGILLGLAALTRPVLLYLPLLLIPLVFAVSSARASRRLGFAVTFVIAFGLAVSPWIVRNLVVFGSPGLSTSGAYNLLVLDVAPGVAAAEGTSVAVATTRLVSEADAAANRLPMPDRENAFRRAGAYQATALAYLRRDREAVALHYVLGMIHSFTNLGTAGFARSLGLGEPTHFEMNDYQRLGDLTAAWSRRKTGVEKVIGAVVGCDLALVDLATALGMVLCVRRRRFRSAAFLLLFAAYFILVAGSGGQARLRLPAVPFYLPFAGLGTAWVWSLRKQDRDFA